MIRTWRQDHHQRPLAVGLYGVLLRSTVYGGVGPRPQTARSAVFRTLRSQTPPRRPTARFCAHDAVNEMLCRAVYVYGLSYVTCVVAPTWSFPCLRSGQDPPAPGRTPRTAVCRCANRTRSKPNKPDWFAVASPHAAASRQHPGHDPWIPGSWPGPGQCDARTAVRTEGRRAGRRSSAELVAAAQLRPVPVVARRARTLRPALLP